MLIMSSAGVLAKAIPWPAPTLIFSRMVIASVTLALFLLLQKKSMKIKSGDRRSLLLQGILLSIHWVAFFQSVKVSTVAVGVVSVATIPIFATFLEPLYHKGKIHKIDVVLAIVSFIGVGLMIEEYSLANTILQGVLLGLLSAFSRAMQLIISGNHVKQYSGTLTMMYQLTVGALLLSPVLYFFPVELETTHISKILLLGIVVTAIGHTLLLSSLKFISVKTSSIIGNVNPVYAIIIAMIFLGEIPPPRILLGSSLIIGAIFVETLQRPK